MTLSEWFEQRNSDGSRRRKGDFARRIGKTPGALTAYLNGTWPGRDAMEAITRETNGEVTANDFMQTEAAE